MSRQVAWHPKRRAGRQQLWTAGREYFIAKQQLDGEPRVFSGTVTDCDVEIAFGQVDEVIGCRDTHIDVRMLLLKTVQPQDKPLGGDRWRRGNGQRPGV